MEKKDCVFCDAERRELPTGIKVCELDYSRLYLFREQKFNPGRCLLASKSHVAEVYQLPQTEREGFLAELFAVARTLEKLYAPDKMNFLSLGDTIGHIHIHLVPKRREDPDWGGMFRFMAKEGYLSEAEYAAENEKIFTALREAGLPAR